MTRPGLLDERIVVGVQTLVPDGLGGRDVTWQALTHQVGTDQVPVGPIWARITPIRGNEAVDRGGVTASQMYRVTIRNRSDLVESMRLQWRGRVLNIRRIEWSGPRDPYLNVIAEAGVPDGG